MALRRAVRHRTRAGANGRGILLGGLAMVLGAGLLAACGTNEGSAGGTRETRASVPEPVDVGTVLEVRATAAGAGDETLSADAVDKLRAVTGVATVAAYLFRPAADGTMVVGIDPLGAALRAPTGQPLNAEVVGGRTWVKGDEAEPSAYVGKSYAAGHKTMLNLDIGKMISPTHSPPVDLGDGTAVNVRAVVETGSAEGDAQVYVPLAFAQQFFGQAGRASRVFVTVASPDQREGVMAAIRAALGEAAEVVAGR